ncbi:SAVED domain-containing protein [Alkalinema pantanalense CENA528]|uniref:SAVED domain-containing protein n=1 Tax=Alkalinema pantanalense TaxID=1620705 RepID=UPI003D6DF187
MARAIAARNQGDDYQARWFWLQVCRLFHSHTKVTRVVYEDDSAKSFDDVVVYFNGMRDSEGNSVQAEYYQVKFHVTSNGALTCQSLLDPDFINATSISLLQRLKAAQEQHAPSGTEAHFILYTPWVIHPDDLLAGVHSLGDGRLDWSRLAKGGPRSQLGKVRAAWREHLELSTDEQLRRVLRPLRLRQGPPLKKLGEELNGALVRAGLSPVDESSLIYPYDELTRKLLQNGKIDFGRADVENICRRENLWVGSHMSSQDTYQIGIRSFLRWAEYLEDETDAILDLVPWFDGRKIQSEQLWQQLIYPKIEQFLSRTLRPSQQCDLHLHVHTSIAFAVGYCLDTKSGINAAVVQSTRAGREVWRPSLQPKPNQYPTWHFRSDVVSENAPDVAIALGITHDISSDVRFCVEQRDLPVHRIITCTLPTGASQGAILDADHAKLLAEQLSVHLKSDRSPKERQGVLHIFIAAPNALVFFIGQTARSFGSCILYEYDFDSNEPGAYESSLAFPPVKHAT